MALELLVQQPLLTPDEAARILNTEKRNVLDWLRAGKLVGIKIGKEWRVAPADLEEFIERNRRPKNTDGQQF